MGKGFKLGAGGGGSDLNFRVICGEKPASAKENTFWVDAVSITGWQFSAYEPVEAPDGTVWIEIADDADIGVNVLKKNVLMVHPVGAWLNVDGVYQPVAAEVFTGAWVSFSTAAVYLYINGDTCDELTGGYVSAALSAGSNIRYAPTISYSDTEMVIKPDKTATPDGKYYGGIVRTTKKIDCSKANKLIFHGTTEGIGVSYATICVWSEIGSKQDANRVKNVNLENGSAPVTVDLSDLDGSYYVGFGFNCAHVQITVTVDELRME